MTSEQLKLQAFASELKENGFTVLVSKRHPFKWLYFEKDGKFGKVGECFDGGFNFSTVHLPCSHAGTGFGVLQGVSELSVKNALQSLYKPSEFIRYKVEYYKSVESFINYPQNKWAEYYIF